MYKQNILMRWLDKLEIIVSINKYSQISGAFPQFLLSVSFFGLTFNHNQSSVYFYSWLCTTQLPSILYASQCLPCNNHSMGELLVILQ